MFPFTQYPDGVQGLYKNCVIPAAGTSGPGLAISAGSSANPKTSAAYFTIRYCGADHSSNNPAVFSAPQTTTTFSGNGSSNNPSLAYSTAGTTPIKDGFSRVYTLLASVSSTNGVVTYSWVNSADIDTHRGPLFETDFNLGDGSKAIVGFIYVKWEPNDGSTWTPGTSALDLTGTTVGYTDATGWVIA